VPSALSCLAQALQLEVHPTGAKNEAPVCRRSLEGSVEHHSRILRRLPYRSLACGSVACGGTGTCGGGCDSCGQGTVCRDFVSFGVGSSTDCSEPAPVWGADTGCHSPAWGSDPGFHTSFSLSPPASMHGPGCGCGQHGSQGPPEMHGHPMQPVPPHPHPQPQPGGRCPLNRGSTVQWSTSRRRTNQCVRCRCHLLKLQCPCPCRTSGPLRPRRPR
jgi:hypothetical protein